MSSISEPGEFHVELPGDWLPCPKCRSATRVAVATIKHRNVGFYCGSMHRLDWEEDNGSTGLWVKHYHFWPGGRFEGLISEDFIGLPKAKNMDRRFDVNERRVDWIHNEQRSCAVCGVPAMRDWHDRKKLFYWLKEHQPNLFGAIMAVVNVTQPRPTLQNWFDGIAMNHQEPRRRDQPQSARLTLASRPWRAEGGFERPLGRVGSRDAKNRDHNPCFRLLPAA